MAGSEEDISIITCADDAPAPGEADNFELPNYVVADDRTDPSSILALQSAYIDLKNRWNASQNENKRLRRLQQMNMNRSPDQNMDPYKLPISEYVPLSSSAQGAAAMPEYGADSRSLTSQIMYLEHQLKETAFQRQKLEVENYQFRTKLGSIEMKLNDAMVLDETRCRQIQNQDQEIKTLKSAVAELEERLKKIGLNEVSHQWRVIEEKMASAKILDKSDADSPGYTRELSSCNDALQLLEDAVRQQFAVVDAVRRQMATVMTDGNPTSPRPDAIGCLSRDSYFEGTSPKRMVPAEHDGPVKKPQDTTFNPLPAVWVKGKPCQLSDGSDVSQVHHSKPNKEILRKIKPIESHQVQVSSSDTATAELVPSSRAHNRESKNERTKYDVLNNSEESGGTTKEESNQSQRNNTRPRSYDCTSSDSNVSNNHRLVAKTRSESAARSYHGPVTHKDVVPIRKSRGEEPKSKERTPPLDATETALTVQLCPLCTEDFSRLTMEEFQNHVFNCFVGGDEKPTASASNDHICPMCSAIFPEQVPQEEFEAHVQQHFEGQITDRFEILPSPN